ncbi:MAG: YggS family pyridoxal phosphate-dependent enzyme [Bacteroidetes bacterium]|nr:YggS family pyridoxal phosphate-dependent enzyme [Bacteroidota bacterium]
MCIHDKLNEILNAIPGHVKLVAVSKTKPAEDILAVYREGHKIFGENKAQELIQKQPSLPDDIQWHFIGHLQRNKVKYLVPFVKLIHGVDSYRLLREINKEAAKADRVIDCLLQFHIASEETKFGLDYHEAEEILESEDFKTFQNVRVCGVMGMATFTEDEIKIRREFKNLKQIFDKLKKSYFPSHEYFREISAGMSNDYPIAIEEGSTIIRVGSLIFGERNYG